MVMSLREFQDVVLHHRQFPDYDPPATLEMETVMFVVKTMRQMMKVLRIKHASYASDERGKRGDIQAWLLEGDKLASLLNRIEDQVPGSAQHVVKGLQGCWNVVSSRYTRALPR